MVAGAPPRLTGAVEPAAGEGRRRRGDPGSRRRHPRGDGGAAAAAGGRDGLRVRVGGRVRRRRDSRGLLPRLRRARAVPLGASAGGRRGRAAIPHRVLSTRSEHPYVAARAVLVSWAVPGSIGIKGVIFGCILVLAFLEIKLEILMGLLITSLWILIRHGMLIRYGMLIR